MKKKINIITITLCSVTVLTLLSLFFILPDQEMSEAENRALKNLPDFSMDALMSGEYTADLSKYISDQFPARDAFVATKAYSELSLGKCQNNGVIYGKNNTLIATAPTGERLQENIDIVKEFKTATGVPVCLAILPSSMDVFAEYLPKSYDMTANDNIWQQFYAQSKNSNLKVAELYTPLCENNNYYRTDHHYTTFGAFHTYELLSDELGFSAKSKEFFNLQTVSNEFCGTSMRSSAFYLTPKDTITLFRYSGDENYTVIADGKQISLYDMSKLDTADKYAVFLGGNHARVDITSDSEKPKLLIIRDSFADSITPF
ncbi:MAG: hypothetical protein IKU82_05315, partial [Clostridia bacterium]|nr:hypothetical protein [Clostridia bacterium]